MILLVIDGQGGGIGKNIIEQIKALNGDITIIAAGTNSLATSAMIKAGADHAATGENAILYNCLHCDMIVGPIGIILSNAMFGEVSSKIADAVSSSPAPKWLVPISKCNVSIAGIQNKPLNQYIDDIVRQILAYLEQA